MGENGGSPAPESADPAIHDLYRRWAELAGSGRLPSAADMELETLLATKSGAALITIEPRADGSIRYCYARAGTGHSRALGRDIQGYSIDELVAPQQVAHFENVYDRIVADRKPHYWMRMNSLLGGGLQTFERLLVPVAEDGKTVDALVGVWVWLDGRADGN